MRLLDRVAARNGEERETARAMTLAAGARLGPYEILAPLGAGGMGEVYRARDTRLDRTVAVKVLPERLSSSEEVRQRFEREAKTISQLSHPHICALYDVGREGETEYLVMEYLEGQTLAERLARGALPLEQVLRYGIEIADALDKAHRSGIVHRDLKPGNVMLAKSGVKLLDFGLAKIFERPRDAAGREQTAAAHDPTADNNLTAFPTEISPLTEKGTILGTFQYMAPEQLEGKDANGRTDIFAFGATLYEMATGRKAFSASSQASLISTSMSSDPPAISTIQSMSPPALDRVVKTCLAKDPEDRWQSAHDVMLQLQWIAEGGSHAGMPAPVLARRRNRERISWGLAIAATLAALIFAAGYFRRAPAPPRAIRFEISTSGWENHDRDIDFAPAVSPDGRRVAFAAEARGGKSILWIRTLDIVAAQPIAGTGDASHPFWSPDGSSLGFFAGGKLKKIASSGGPVQSICDAEVGRGGTWNRDGTILFASSSFSPIYRVSASGGTPSPITHLDLARGETSHRWPQFLPDGRHFLYLAYVSPSSGANNASGGISAGSLDDKETKLILPDQSNAVYSEAGYLLFYRDGNLIAQPFDAGRLQATGDPFPVAQRVSYVTARKLAEFSISGSGVLAYVVEATPPLSRLRWFDRAGREISSIGGVGSYRNPRLSPDGRQIAVTMLEPDSLLRSDVWMVDTARGGMTRVTANSFFNRSLCWFPDGNRIAFSSERGGFAQIFAKEVNGSAEQPLHPAKTTEVVTDISSDGRFLVYSTLGPKTLSDVWVMDLTGKHASVPFAQTKFDQGQGQFSPDGRSLAYVSDETGVPELYVAPFPGPGARIQISSGGGTQPRWRRAGKELFYLSGRKLMSFAVLSGSKLEAGTPKMLFELRDVPPTGGLVANWQYDVSADGQRLLVNTPEGERPSSPITVVQNWTAELKR